MKSNQRKQERINEIVGVLLLLVGLFTLISLLFFHPSDFSFYTSYPNSNPRNVTGVVGVYVSHYLILVFGLSSFAIPGLLLFWSGCFFLQKVPQKKWIEIAGLIIALFSIASIASLVVGPSLKVKAGGFLGYFAASNLERYFGGIGGLIISVCCLFLSLILATDFLLYPLMNRIAGAFLEQASRIKDRLGELVHVWFSRSEEKTDKPRRVCGEFEAEPKVFEPSEPPKVKRYSEPEIKLNTPLPTAPRGRGKTDGETSSEPRPKISAAKENETGEKEEAAIGKIVKTDTSSYGNYRIPPVDLLNMPEPTRIAIKDDLHRNSQILEETLADFGIEAKVVAIEQGPVITRYELMPAPGVKVNRIVSLGDDLALVLRATSVRFLAPIPGKAAVGVEIPNSTTAMVYLRELLQSSEYKNRSFQLPLTLGKDTSGKPLVTELADMPHLLIAGATGSGKTVCVNALIAGLLHSKSPANLKFVMIDPKMVEMAVYKDIPHMLAPVVTDSKKAAATLNWVVGEMERRYKIFAACGMRNIQSFNNRSGGITQDSDGNEIPNRLPYIIIVIDELADLMVVAQDKVESAITRLAQLSRAVGIHLILATQRPSVDVITGVIKANFPARISFKVASKVDSRTVLDMNGAEKLLGKGDMLFLEPGQPKPVRGQCAFITDEEISRTVEFIKSQERPQYLEELAAIQSGSNISAFQNTEKDELYEEAVRVVVETRQASVSVLQRKLRLGYGRAARIIDMMEQEGLVGPPQGAKPREIFMDRIETTTSKSSAPELS